jgi:two-component system chemotaxis response regulator CheY
MTAKRVLSVGQCWADHGSIARTLKKEFGTEVDRADDVDGALERLRQGGYSLVLVNRVFDADGASGMDLIQRVKADPALSAVPVMLVSNYDDAQAEARTAGAAPGFGKAALGRPMMLERVKPFLGGE